MLEPEDFTQTTAQALNVEAASNRLLGLQQTITRTQNGKSKTSSTTVPYAVDASGALTGDGLRSFEYDASNRLAKVQTLQGGEPASITYLHNALGQRVFKSEALVERNGPDEAELGVDFVAWLKRRFGWLWTRPGDRTGLGTAFVYGDGELPPYALLGEYDNGSATLVAIHPEESVALVESLAKAMRINPPPPSAPPHPSA